MLFEVVCENNIYFYDNITNQVFDEDNLLIDLSTKESTLPNIRHEYMGSGYCGKSSAATNTLVTLPSNVEFLSIFLGSKCNYRCSYCFQNQKDYSPPYDEQSFRSGLRKSGMDFKKIKRIEIWGGEPLVYWKRFKSIVKTLRTDLAYSNLICAVVNGSLFTEEVKNFCLEYRVKIFFSHDGAAQKLLRCEKDYLDDPRVLSNIKDFLIKGHLYVGGNTSGLIMPTVNPYTESLDDNILYMYDRIYEGVTVRQTAPMQVNKNTEHLLQLYTEERKIALKNDYKRAMLLPHGHPMYMQYYFVRTVKDKAVYRLIHGHHALSYSSGARCEPQDFNIAAVIDSDGNYMSASSEFSTDDDIVSGNMSDGKPIVYHWKHTITEKKQCMECPYLVSCRLGRLRLDDQDFNLRCTSHIFFRAAAFEAIWNTLFDDNVVSINSIKPIKMS